MENLLHPFILNIFVKSLRVIFPEACFVPRCLRYPVACCGVVHLDVFAREF